MTETDKAQGYLDPEHWTGFRKRAHETLDRALDKMEQAASGRVWTPVPDEIEASLSKTLDKAPLSATGVDEALTGLLPYGVGNTHPRFFGWVHGSGTPFGLLPAMIEGAMNANCGGRNHVGLRVERALAEWLRQLFGFPEGASGLVMSGTSMATIVAMKVARDAALDFRSRELGVDQSKLVAYTSAEAHACNARAFDVLGLGSDTLRRIPVDADFRMDTNALKAAIDADRGAGLRPFALIGTAGTVNTGAIDPLAKLATIAASEQLWFHIDGAFAAVGQLSKRLRPKLAGIERANSLAFDFHKWLHVNYDAGFVLVREGDLHRRSFSSRPDYLKGTIRGLAAGDPWPVEYGPELSRGFRALKIWAHIAEFGPTRLGQAISRNCDLAETLADLIDAAGDLERLSPVETGICCLRYIPSAGRASVDLDSLNEEIVTRLHESGVAAPSTTRIHGKLAIRVNMTNHRTRESDLHILIDTIRDLAPGAMEAIQPA